MNHLARTRATRRISMTPPLFTSLRHLSLLAMAAAFILGTCPQPAAAAEHDESSREQPHDLQQLINRRNELMKRKDELVRKIVRERQHQHSRPHAQPGGHHKPVRPGHHAGNHRPAHPGHHHPAHPGQSHSTRHHDRSGTSVLEAMQNFQRELDELERQGKAPKDPSMEELKRIVKELRQIEEQIRKATPPEPAGKQA